MGKNVTYTITPNTGYQISDVLVDGVSQGNITSYTFTNIQKNHDISASFTLIPTPTPRPVSVPPEPEPVGIGFPVEYVYGLVGSVGAILVAFTVLMVRKRK